MRSVVNKSPVYGMRMENNAPLQATGCNELAGVSRAADAYLVRHGNAPADYRIFRGEPLDYRTVTSAIQDGGCA